MSLTKDDKKLLTQLHLQKANMCLADAEQLMTTNSISSAANRFYYAVFHTMHALFVANGIYTKSHHGANALLNQHFVRTGLLEPRFGRFVALMENMREKADYDVLYTITKEELEELKPLAYEFTQQAERLLSNERE